MLTIETADVLTSLREAEFLIWLHAFEEAPVGSAERETAGDRMASLYWEDVPIPAEHDTQNQNLFPEEFPSVEGTTPQC